MKLLNERQGPRVAPQCVTCRRFCKVDSARRIEEPGEFGTVLSVEFECERCANRRWAPEERAA